LIAETYNYHRFLHVAVLFFLARKIKKQRAGVANFLGAQLAEKLNTDRARLRKKVEAVGLVNYKYAM
jgi:hypothetical protein